MTIGEQIRTIRKHHNLTQKELADFAKIAVVTLQQYESGKRQPRLGQLQKIASVFGGSVEDIFELERPTLSQADQYIINMSLAGIDFTMNKEKIIINEFNKLNDEGKDKAIEQVGMLTQIPGYQKLKEAADEVRKQPTSLPNVLDAIKNANLKEGEPIVLEDQTPPKKE